MKVFLDTSVSCSQTLAGRESGYVRLTSVILLINSIMPSVHGITQLQYS